MELLGAIELSLRFKKDACCLMGVGRMQGSRLDYGNYLCNNVLDPRSMQSPEAIYIIASDSFITNSSYVM